MRIAPHTPAASSRPGRLLPILLAICLLAGCRREPPRPTGHTGDEIVVCGQFIHTGAPVVLWMDEGGYDAYRVDGRFTPPQPASGPATSQPDQPSPRYGVRAVALTEDQARQLRDQGWDLPLLQAAVDQFVIHFDGSGASRRCFKTLHEDRALSVHFLLDLDGTIYQTLDLKERAWHATIANNRSVGIEIASPGAFASDEKDTFDVWYTRDAGGRLRLAGPAASPDSGIRTPNFVPRPASNALITGEIQGKSLRQYDFTPQQYDSLIKLTAALCRTFPKLRCDYPRDAKGNLVRQKLPDEQLATYQGLLGHYHVQTNKVDPGPAFQWDQVIEGARRLTNPP